MAVDSKTLPTCNAETVSNHEGAEPAGTAGDGAEAAAAPMYKKGAWSKEEDEKLIKAVEEYGVRNWVTIEKFSGLARPAKNCRLRWLNYLRPNLKKYPFTPEEERLILELHAKYGNSWSRIASKLPGRSDNEIKNFWHKRAKKCQKHHIPLYPTTKEDNQNNHDETKLASSSSHTPDTPSSIHSPQTHMCFSNPSNSSSSLTSPPPTHLTPNTANSLLPPHQRSTQTPLMHNPATSQMQNMIVSPHPRSQPSPQSMPSESQPQMLVQPPLWQGGATSNAFTPIKDSPTLSSPQGRFSRDTTQLSQKVHPHPVGSASSTFLPSTSTPQIQWSSSSSSSSSAMQLKLSPGVPPVYSVQTSTQTTDAPMPSFSTSYQLGSPTVPPLSPHISQIGSPTIVPVSPHINQLGSPTVPPLSPHNMHLSTTVASESCFRSNLAISESKLQLNTSVAAVSLPSPQLKPSTCSQDIPPIQPVIVDNNHVIPLDSSTKPSTCSQDLPPIQPMEVDSDCVIRPDSPLLATPEVSTSVHEGESESNLEIMDELMEAIEKVRFLKRKLKHNRTSKKRTEPQDRECSSGTSTKTKHFHGELKVNSREKDVLKRILRGKCQHTQISKAGALQVKNSEKENNKRENPHTQPEKATQSENLETKPVSGECMMLEGLFSESSTLLQDSFSNGDLFSQSSGIEDLLSSQRQHMPLSDVFGPVYCQSTATTPAKPNEGGYFGDSFGQEFPDDTDQRRFTEDVLCESNLLLHQYPATELQDSSYLVNKPMMNHDSFSLPTVGPLDSSCPKGKQVMKQEQLGGEKSSIQTSSSGNSAETSKLSESTLLRHPCPTANQVDRYLMDLEHDFPRGEQYSLQTSAMKAECTPTETWKQEPSPEQSSMEDLLIENIWPQAQMDFQDQALLANRLDSAVDPNAMTHLTESKNWSHESDFGYTGEVQDHEQHDGYMSGSSEELAGLVEFFPSTMEKLEWYNDCNAIPGKEASAESDMQGLFMPSAPQSLISIADYL